MLKTTVAVLALLASSQAVLAQQVRGAGGQLQQIPPAPVREPTVPEIRIDKGSAPAVPLADDLKIMVSRLQVSGQTVYSEAELVAITGFRPGSEASLGELRAMAQKIADHYHRNGYFVAQAYLPAQDIKDGAVSIAVIEGRYGSITLRNQTTLAEADANRLLGGLNSGDLVAIAPLEERLLRLSDIAGVKVKSTLTPGTTVGTADLIVELTPGPRVSGSVEADNAGNRYTGEYRVGGTVSINNLTGHGDVVTLRGLTSGSGMTYGRAAYERPFGRAMFGAAYTRMDYELGKEFESLQANGSVDIVSLYGAYSLIRTRQTNLSALLNLDFKTFEDRVDSTTPQTVTDKESQVLTASISGDRRDGFGGGGLSTGSLAWSTGNLDIQSPAALAADAATARSNGHFDKLGFHAMRLQNLGGPFTLSAAIGGQFASKNLDISEKMELGGMYAVRAYPEGEAFADEGYVLKLELKMLLPKPTQLPGQMHLIGFVDHGEVTLHEDPWTSERNRRTLKGAGLGLTWAEVNDFAVTTYWAHKLGDEVATSAPDESNRFWIHLVKYF